MQIERAVFTSPKSGGGYQIVAQSPSIDARLHRELVRRAPSHGALVEESEAAGGLAMLRLEAGPWCLMKSRTAGAEPSGRPGYCLHTDCFLLKEDDYGLFQHNPALFLEALVAQGATRIREYGARLEPLELVGEARRFPVDKLRAAVEHVGPCAVASIAAAACRGEPMLVYAPQACDILAAAVLCGLPEAHLQGATFTSGLRPSQQRPASLSFLPCVRPTNRSEMIDLEGDRVVLEVERLVDAASAEPDVARLSTALGGDDDQIRSALEALSAAPASV